MLALHQVSPLQWFVVMKQEHLTGMGQRCVSVHFYKVKHPLSLSAVTAEHRTLDF